jgi:predicted protein tyrosine phosphatase
MKHSTRARRVLFVCAQNRCRSATAERVFCKRQDLDVRSAGTSRDAMVRVSRRMLDWADVIFTMDEDQRVSLERMFPSHPALPDLICLGIPDAYAFLQPELVKLLEERVTPHLMVRLKPDTTGS